MHQSLCLETEQNRLSLNLTKSSSRLCPEWSLGADCGTEGLWMVIKIPGVWGHPLELGSPPGNIPTIKNYSPCQQLLSGGWGLGPPSLWELQPVHSCTGSSSCCGCMNRAVLSCPGISPSSEMGPVPWVSRALLSLLILILKLTSLSETFWIDVISSAVVKDLSPLSSVLHCFQQQICRL